MAFGQTIPSQKLVAAKEIGLTENFQTIRVAYPAEWSSTDAIFMRDSLDQKFTALHWQTTILLKEKGFEIKFQNPQNKAQFLDWMIDNKHPMANEFHGQTASLEATRTQIPRPQTETADVTMSSYPAPIAMAS